MGFSIASLFYAFPQQGTSVNRFNQYFPTIGTGFLKSQKVGLNTTIGRNKWCSIPAKNLMQKNPPKTTHSPPKTQTITYIINWEHTASVILSEFKRKIIFYLFILWKLNKNKSCSTDLIAQLQLLHLAKLWVPEYRSQCDLNRKPETSNGWKKFRNSPSTFLT